MARAEEAMSRPIFPDPALKAFLVDHALIHPGEAAQWEPLAGGVSSDIWQVELPGRALCVKRALPRLKVSAEWLAPVSRNAYEWEWLQFAAQHCPDNVPRPLAHDAEAGLFAMSFLPPDEHPVWKTQLLTGEVSLDTAREVGRLVGFLHAASARREDLAAAFDSTDNFYSLRLEPYLIASARKYPVVEWQLGQLVESTKGMRLALVHGDVSPKNILVGPHGPVLLDAECAWYGDPAFDLAFCLNHLLLKCLVRRHQAEELLDAFATLAEAYLREVTWEAPAGLEKRASRLLPGLLLARVDGKSPVEYLTQERERKLVRRCALSLLLSPEERLFGIASLWRSALSRYEEETN
jgi:5-methylthioribose kinase